MTLVRVGLIDTTKAGLDPGLLQSVAAALNTQVTRDLPQFWPIQATVQYLPRGTKVPVGVWAVRLVDQLPPGEGGFHQDKHNQPYAKVIASAKSDEWTIDASHETIEMLVDPYGNRLHASHAIATTKDGVKDAPGVFEYLVEACDPCEADHFAYPIQGVAVSDFITPHYYDPIVTPGTRYSFTGAIKAPRQLLKGGYISFINPQAGEVQQILYVDPTKPPQLVDLGPAEGASLRRWVHSKTDDLVRKNRQTNPGLLDQCRQYRATLEEAAEKHEELAVV
jgi:hypothetical protein